MGKYERFLEGELRHRTAEEKKERAAHDEWAKGEIAERSRLQRENADLLDALREIGEKCNLLVTEPGGLARWAGEKARTAAGGSRCPYPGAGCATPSQCVRPAGHAGRHFSRVGGEW